MSGFAPGLSVEVAHTGRGVAASFQVEAGRCAALVGPNGAGKSSVLDMVAGLLRPTSGRVLAGDRTLVDVERKIDVPVWRRKVALLAQRAALFDQVSVVDNVAFALRIAGVGRAAARERALEWLSRLGCEVLAGRGAREISGGQAQRVALARALAAEPVVLLLDEPFGAVDVQAAAELRALLRRLLAETGQTCLMVTHDFADVATLADQVVVLESGRVVQSTSARGLLEAPSTEFSARLVGLNFLRSDSELVLFPPAAARVEECAGADGYRGTLLGVLSHGEDLRALVRAEHGTIEARVDPELGRRLVPGEAVVVAVDPARLRRAHGPG